MILSHMEKLGSDRKVVLLTNVEYTIDRACEKLRRNYNYWWEKKQKSRGKQTFVEDQVSQREWSWKKILPRAINGRKLEITTVLKTAQRILFGVVCLRLWLYFKINLFNSKKKFYIYHCFNTKTVWLLYKFSRFTGIRSKSRPCVWLLLQCLGCCTYHP